MAKYFKYGQKLKTIVLSAEDSITIGHNELDAKSITVVMEVQGEGACPWAEVVFNSGRVGKYNLQRCDRVELL